jgi:hypothetical protein
VVDAGRQADRQADIQEQEEMRMLITPISLCRHDPHPHQVMTAKMRLSGDLDLDLIAKKTPVRVSVL